MGNYHDELTKIEKFFAECLYDACSMNCGKQIELALKDLLNVYIENTTEARRKLLKENIHAGKPPERLTMGELAKLYESERILEYMFGVKKSNYKEIRVLNLEMIARIRNQATHDKKVIGLEKSDALLLHGFLLKLLTITGLLDVEGNGKTNDVGRQTDHENGKLDQRDKEKTDLASVKKVNGLKITMTEIPNEDEKRQPDQQISAAEKDQTEKVGKEQTPSAETEENVDEGTYTSVGPVRNTDPLIKSDLITVAQNKESGKYFIYLENNDESNDKVINPFGKILSFDAGLYGEPEEKELACLISESLINDAQIKEYNKQKEPERYSDDLQQQEGLPLRRRKIVTGIAPPRPKKVFPRGCTVDGNYYKSGSEAIKALLSKGKIRKGNLPTSEYNAHKWLKENYYKFGITYKRDGN